MARHRAIRGFGLLLAIVVLFLITWSIIGIAQMTFSGSVTDTVQNATAGSMAVAFAQSAIEETFHEVSLAVNQAGTPFYVELRREYVKKEAPWKTYSVKPERTLEAFAADPLYRGFELLGGAVSVKVLGERPLTTLTYESRGTLEFTARVRQGPVSRTVRQTRGFKVALASTPRPFDQVTWLLRHPEPLYGADANANLDTTVQKALELATEKRTFAGNTKDIDAFVNQEVSLDNQKAAEWNQYVTDPILQAMCGDLTVPENPAKWWAYEDSSSVIDAAKLEPPPQGLQTFDVTRDYHKFPPDLVLYSIKDELPPLSRSSYVAGQAREQMGVIQQEEAQENTALTDLRAKLEAGETAAQDMARWRAQASGELQRSPSCGTGSAVRDQGNAQLAKLETARQALTLSAAAYAKSLESLSLQLRKLWDIYHQITALNGPFMELSGASSREMAGYDGKFEISSEPWAQQGRAFMRFSRPKAAERFLKFLKDQPPGRPLNGVLFVDNASEALSLRGVSIHGKLDLLVSGPADLEDVKLADPANDLFTLQAQAGQSVRISGTVQASVMAAGPVDFSEGSVLSGSLIQRDLVLPASLNGTILHDKRYFSGFSPKDEKLDHLVVALSPIPSTNLIARQ